MMNNFVEQGKVEEITRKFVLANGISFGIFAFICRLRRTKGKRWGEA